MGFYPAFSPVPAALAGNRWFVFCDTFRRYGLSPAAPGLHQPARCLTVSGLSSQGWVQVCTRLIPKRLSQDRWPLYALRGLLGKRQFGHFIPAFSARSILGLGVE